MSDPTDISRAVAAAVALDKLAIRGMYEQAMAHGVANTGCGATEERSFGRCGC